MVLQDDITQYVRILSKARNYTKKGEREERVHRQLSCS